MFGELRQYMSDLFNKLAKQKEGRIPLCQDTPSVSRYLETPRLINVKGEEIKAPLPNTTLLNHLNWRHRAMEYIF